MPIPSSRSYIGIAKEVTRGTVLAPTMSIPVSAPAAHDEITMLQDQGLRGSAVNIYGAVPGPAWSTWEVTGDVYPDSIGFWLQSLLPDLVTTGAGPFVHTFASLNSGTSQPKTYCVADYSGLGATSGARYFPALQATELGFKYDAAGKFTYDVKCLGNPSSLVPTSAPTNTQGALTVVPAYLPTITIGGGAVTTVEAGDFTLKRPVSVIHTADATQSPYTLFSGPLDVTGNITFVAEDEVELLRYLNNTQPSLVIAFPAGPNATTLMTFTCTKVFYSPADPIRTKDYTEVQVAYQAIANTTDVGASTGYSPIKAVLTNSKASGTYG